MENSISLDAFPFGQARGSVVPSLPLDPGREIAFALVASNMRMVRRHVREHKAKTGQSLSFAGFVVSNLAHRLPACA